MKMIKSTFDLLSAKDLNKISCSEYALLGFPLHLESVDGGLLELTITKGGVGIYFLPLAKELKQLLNKNHHGECSIKGDAPTNKTDYILLCIRFDHLVEYKLAVDYVNRFYNAFVIWTNQRPIDTMNFIPWPIIHKTKVKLKGRDLWPYRIKHQTLLGSDISWQDVLCASSITTCAKNDFISKINFIATIANKEYLYRAARKLGQSLKLAYFDSMGCIRNNSCENEEPDANCAFLNAYECVEILYGGQMPSSIKKKLNEEEFYREVTRGFKKHLIDIGNKEIKQIKTYYHIRGDYASHGGRKTLIPTGHDIHGVQELARTLLIKSVKSA